MTAALAAWLPVPQDVANLIPQRTGNPAGDAQGNFTSTTVPTATQLQGLIRGVQSEVATVVGAMPDALAVVPTGGTTGESAAGHVVALGAAALVETGFYPEMQLGGDSPSAVMERRYRAALAGLMAAASDLDAGTDPGAYPLPVATYPNTVAMGLATTPFERW